MATITATSSVKMNSGETPGSIFNFGMLRDWEVWILTDEHNVEMDIEADFWPFYETWYWSFEGTHLGYEDGEDFTFGSLTGGPIVSVTVMGSRTTYDEHDGPGYPVGYTEMLTHFTISDISISSDLLKGVILSGTLEDDGDMLRAMLAGDDTFNLSGDDDVAYGFGGNDTMNGDSGSDVLRGGAGEDSLIGGAGNDTLHGDEDNDHLDGSEGRDTLVGGAGNDTYVSYGRDSYGLDIIVENAGEGIDTVRSSANNTLGANLENLVLTGSASIDGRGNALGNTITGNAAANSIFGLAGNDAIEGNGGSDMLDGGQGNDFLNGGEGDDTLHGQSGNDILSGNFGSDILYGGNGNDLMSGWVGTDSLLGGSGNDQMYGGANDDYLEGGGGSDILHGDEGEEYGNDRLDGGDGSDELYGGLGSDTLDGGSGHDLLDGGDQVDDLYGRAGNDRLDGGKGNDYLSGGSGNDTLAGGDGDDRLFGGAGWDRLTGGAGIDHFIFDSTAESTRAARDRIMDFNAAEGDRIDLDRIDADTTSSDSYDLFTFIGGNAFSGHAGELRAFKVGTTGNLYRVEGDTDGNGVADFSLDVTSGSALKESDFFLFHDILS